MEILLGALTLLAGILVPIWLHRRAHPERELRYRAGATRVLQTMPSESSPLTIRLGDQAVGDPHSVTFELWSTGRADIATSVFDSGRPLLVSLGASILPGTLRVIESQPVRVSIEQVSAEHLSIKPQLLPKTLRVALSAMTDASPTVTVENPLIDVSVIGSGTIQQEPAPNLASVGVSRDSRRPRVTALLITNGLTISTVALFFAGIIIYALDPERDPMNGGIVLSAVTILIFGACVVSYVVIGITRAARLIQSSRSK